VLSDKPPITSTIQSLPPALLETLLNELSTLASVYHKPPETFLGQGKFGAEAMQKAAIEYVTSYIDLHHTKRSLGSKSSLLARTLLLLRLRLLLQEKVSHTATWKIS
jgi:hypothetical protein